MFLQKQLEEYGMENLLEFTDNDDEILKNYTVVSKENLSEKEYKKYLKKYPEIQNQELYILNKITKQDQERLNEIISEPLMILYSITNDEMSSKLKEQMSASVPEEQKEIISQMTTMQVLNSMPKEQKQMVINQIKTKLEESLGTMINQAAIVATKAEYQAIGIDLDQMQNNYILISGLKMLGIALVSMAAAITIMLFSSRVAAKLGRTLRDKVFKKVLSFSKEELTKFSTASLITRSTNDIQQIQNLITMLFRVVIYAPIMGVGGFIMVLTRSDSSMAYIIGITVTLIISIVAILFAIAMPKFKKLQDLIDKINLVSRETLTGLPVIRAFNTEKREERKFDNANKDLMKANIFVNRAMSIMMPMMMLIMNSVMLVIIWVGGHKVADGIMQVGDMMAFIQYTMQIVISFLMISIISIMLPRASVSARRINEVIETKPNIKDNKITKNFIEEKRGYVEFKNVSFRYPDADTEILTDISFTAKPGETTAIIGSTGSGKSTVVNLIPRFYDVTRWRIIG